MDEQKNTPGCCTARPSYWKELSIEDKIERMRDVVKGIQNQNDRLERRIRELSVHDHKDGKLIVPFDEYGRGSGTILSRQQNPDEVYF